MCYFILSFFTFLISHSTCIFHRFEEAEHDCTEALNLDDRYVKAYSRRATARKELGKFKASMEGQIRSYSSIFSQLVGAEGLYNETQKVDCRF